MVNKFFSLKMTLFWKFFLSSFIMIILFGIFVSAMVHITMKTFFFNETMQYQVTCLKKLESNFSYNTNKIVHLINNMQLPDELAYFEELTDVEKYEIGNQVSESMNDLMVYSNIFGVSLITNGRTFVSGQYVNDVKLLNESEWPENFDLYQRDTDDESSYMTLLKRVKQGLVIIQTDPMFLSDRSEGYGVFVIGSNGETIWKNNISDDIIREYNDMIAADAAQSDKVEFNDKRGPQFVSMKMTGIPAEIAMYVDSGAFSENENKMTQYIVFTMLIMLFVCVLLSLMMSKIITKRIKVISDKMRNYKLHTYIEEKKTIGIGLKKKIIIYYLVVCILPIVAMSMIYYIKSAEMLKEEILKTFEQSIDYERINVTAALNKYEVDGKYIANNKYIQSLLSGIKGTDTDKLYPAIQTAVTDPGCENLILYNINNDNIYGLKQGVKRPEGVNYDEFVITEPHYDEYNQRVLSMVMPIRGNDYRTKYYMDRIGCLVIDIKESILTQTITTNENDRIKTYITNADNIVMVAQNASDIDRSISSYIDNNKTVCQKSVNETWNIYGIIENDSLLKNKQKLIMRFIIIALVAVFALFVLSKRIAGVITTSIDTVSNSIKNNIISGHRVKIQLKTGDEIEELCKSFNSMNEEIDRLIGEVYAQEREKNELEQRRRDAALNALQAQINPHFLYNTFDSVNWLIREGKNDEAVSMITTLADMLRLGVNRKNNILSLRDEIKHAKLYIDIQKMRYGDKLNVMWEYDESVLDAAVPKTIFQPVLENAIRHGINHRPEGGEIEISIERQGDELEIHVIDSGIGIEKEKLEAINNDLEMDDNSILKNIGLKNAHDRIRLMFGKNYGMHINSEPLQYTDVTICLRYVRYTKQEN